MLNSSHLQSESHIILLDSFHSSTILSISNPEAISSPKTCSPTMNTAKTSLRILNINFQSIRKKGKNIDVSIDSTSPDIIFGTET